MKRRAGLGLPPEGHREASGHDLARAQGLLETGREALRRENCYSALVLAVQVEGFAALAEREAAQGGAGLRADRYSPIGLVRGHAEELRALAVRCLQAPPGAKIVARQGIRTAMSLAAKGHCGLAFESLSMALRYSGNAHDGQLLPHFERARQAFAARCVRDQIPALPRVGGRVAPTEGPWEIDGARAMPRRRKRRR